jgi:hypothetical protein
MLGGVAGVPQQLEQSVAQALQVQVVREVVIHQQVQFQVLQIQVVEVVAHKQVAALFLVVRVL